MYAILDPKYLLRKGIKYFDTISDGRAIVPANILKALGNVENVQLITSMKDLTEIELKNQNK